MKEPLIDKECKIERQLAKGGWNYVVIDGIPPHAKAVGGTVRVSGTVDTYVLQQFNLLPMKDGAMLLPLKAALRKAIQKKAGDTVHVTLFADQSPVEIPEDIHEALTDSPTAYAFFLTLSDSNKKYYIDWIEESKKIDTKVARILKTIRLLENKKKFWDWPPQNELR